MDFRSRQIHFSDEHDQKIEKSILHTNEIKSCRKLKNLFHKKNNLNYTTEKLYEYPGGNQVDGLLPVASFFHWVCLLLLGGLPFFLLAR